jgi:hypothetical protein
MLLEVVGMVATPEIVTAGQPVVVVVVVGLVGGEEVRGELLYSSPKLSQI